MNTHLFSSARRAGSRRAASFAAAVAIAGGGMLASTSHAQKSWAQSYGARSYDANGAPTNSATQGSGYDVAKGIARMPDGGFVVAGHLELPQAYSKVFNAASGSHKNAALVRYAADGSIVWQQLLRQDNDRTLNDGTYQPASSHVYTVLTDAQGNIFICGGKGNPDNGGQIPFVAKFNPNGGLIWQRGIANAALNSNGTTSTAALTRDGGVLVTLGQGGNGTLDPALAKLNSDGSLAFFAVYDQAIQYNTTAAVTESATENNVYVAVVGDIAGLTLLRIDGSGNLLGLRNTRDGAARRTELQVGLVATADGGYATLTRAGQFGDSVVLRKFDRNLVPIFEKQIQPVGFGFVGDKLVAEPDGGFLISGASGARQAGGPEVYPGGGGFEAAIMRVSAAGAVQFVSALGGPQNEGGGEQFAVGTYVVRAADRGYAFTTTTFSYRADSALGKPDWWTVKTDVNRRVTNFGGLMADLPLSWFTTTNVPNSGTSSPAFARVPGNVIVSTAPNFIFENLATKTGINKPDVIFQATNIAPDPGPPLPATTGFTVNDSAIGIAVAKDSVLRMRVSQPSTAGRLSVRVQSSTTPADDASWTDLNNGSSGRMIFDVTTGTYVLNTTTYPRLANVHFRAISSAPANSNSVSNVVGPFDLASSAQHLGRTILSTTRNGIGAKINFRAFDETHPAGVSMRIQSSTSPGNESSWTDLTDGNGGKMTPFGNPGNFYLDSNKYPANGAVYFRTVASAPGYVDSPSRGVGPFNLSNSPSPLVTVTSPATPGEAFGGDFQFATPLPPGAFTIEANAQPNGGPAIKNIALLFDGETIGRSPGSNASRIYTAAPGDHVIEAFALDELNVTGDSVPVYVRIAPPFGKIFNRVHDGDWNDATGWSTQDLQSGVPGPNDLANVAGHNVTLSQDVTVLAATLHGGSIDGPGALTITGTFTVSAGKLPIPNLTIERGGTLLLANEIDIGMSGTVNNLGKMMLIGGAGITGINNDSAKPATAGDGDETEAKEIIGFVKAVIKNVGDWFMGRRTGGKREAQKPPSPQPTPVPQPTPDVARTVLIEAVENTGTLISHDGGSLISHDGGSLLGQDGAGVISTDGAGVISTDGAGLIGQDGAGVIGQDGAGLIGQDGAGLIGQDGAGLRPDVGGYVVSAGAGNFAQPGRAVRRQRSKAATAAGGIVQSAGTMNLNGIRLIGPVVLNGGVLSGSGLIYGHLTNDGGFIAPGNSAGSISVTGNFTQIGSGSLLLEVGGINSYRPDFDQLKIGGEATLGGKLIAKTINGFTPNGSTQLVPLSYASATGAFASISGNAQLDLRDTGAALAIVGTNPSSAKLLNIATRLRVERGQDALIGGFIITGSAPKRVIVRALGPSLADRGIAGGLADPTLELFRPDGSEFNNSWRDLQEGDIAGTGIQPSDDREAAIVATLEPGVAYTAVVRGVGDTTGVGLVEVYDLDAAAPSTLANISTRGLVQTGENVMIGGLIIGGDQPAKVLVRAIGPSLGAAGVEGALQDPTLELYTAQGAVFTNDDWRATQEGEIIASTVPPSDSREAAIVATLPAGNYTAIVRGKGDTTGVALIEAYNLQ
jgi:hypothetical protein